MSTSNDPGEEGQRTDSSTDEFQFYFPFAKTLALELITPEDKSIAAAWVQKLEAAPETEAEKQTRLNYLKLLLFVLQRGRLSGIFKKEPPQGALEPFPQGLSILDMGNMMLNQDDAPSCAQGDARCLPYTIEISNDLREFVASQEIPNFGVQMYYAWSSEEPIHKWLSFDQEKFPQYVLDKIKQLNEIKSDEKTTIKNGCITLRKGCNIPLLEKTSRKKVKTPQEIEKSQGRSFHTYMGLVGRLGNFEKCDDDQDKYQRPEARKGRPMQRNGQRPCPMSGGEAENVAPEEECENPPTGSNTQNKPCLCPNSLQRTRTILQPAFAKKGSQPCDNQQQMLGKTYTCEGSSGTEGSPWSAAALLRSNQRRLNEEQCPDNEMAPQLQSRKRVPSPRTKTNVGNAPNVECPLQDGGDEFRNTTGHCICPSPPCSCACPRTQNQGSARKTPSFTNVLNEGRPVDPSRTVTKQDNPLCRRRLFQEKDNECPGGGGSEGSKMPMILHCYSEENPDPNLAQVAGKANPPQWSDNNACQQQYPKGNAPGGRGCFNPNQQTGRLGLMECQRTMNDMSGVQQITPSPQGQRHRSPLGQKSSRSPSPEGGPRPCQPAQEQPPCRPTQQGAFNPRQIAHDYLEYDGPPPNRPNQLCPSNYRKPTSAPCKGSQPMFRPKSYYSNNVEAGPNNADCMRNLQQGMKQKADAHREKCDQLGTRKSPNTYGQGGGPVCPEQGPPMGGPGMPPYCPEKRSPRANVCPEGAGYLKQSSPPKQMNVKCPTHMPEAGYQNVMSTSQGKRSPCPPYALQQSPRPQGQPCSSTCANRRQDAPGEEEMEEGSSESGVEECPKECGAKFNEACQAQKQSRIVPQIVVEEADSDDYFNLVHEKITEYYPPYEIPKRPEKPPKTKKADKKSCMPGRVPKCMEDFSDFSDTSSSKSPESQWFPIGETYGPQNLQALFGDLTSEPQTPSFLRSSPEKMVQQGPNCWGCYNSSGSGKAPGGPAETDEFPWCGNGPQAVRNASQQQQTQAERCNRNISGTPRNNQGSQCKQGGMKTSTPLVSPLCNVSRTRTPAPQSVIPNDKPQSRTCQSTVEPKPHSAPTSNAPFQRTLPQEEKQSRTSQSNFVQKPHAVAALNSPFQSNQVQEKKQPRTSQITFLQELYPVTALNPPLQSNQSPERPHSRTYQSIVEPKPLPVATLNPPLQSNQSQEKTQPSQTTFVQKPFGAVPNLNLPSQSDQPQKKFSDQRTSPQEERPSRTSQSAVVQKPNTVPTLNPPFQSNLPQESRQSGTSESTVLQEPPKRISTSNPPFQNNLSHVKKQSRTSQSTVLQRPPSRAATLNPPFQSNLPQVKRQSRTSQSTILQRPPSRAATLNPPFQSNLSQVKKQSRTSQGTVLQRPPSRVATLNPPFQNNLPPVKRRSRTSQSTNIQKLNSIASPKFPSQSKLSRVKSQSRTHQSPMMQKPNCVAYSKPTPPKSENRFNVKPRVESKPTTKIKSETIMKHISETVTKCRSKSNFISKELICEIEWRTSPQLTFEDQNFGQQECCNQIQTEPCSVQEFPPPESPSPNFCQNWRPNPYFERSMNYHKERAQLPKLSSPKNWMGCISRDNFPNISSIPGSYIASQNHDQSEFCEEDDNLQYMPLESENQDCSVGKVMNKRISPPANQMMNCNVDNSPCLQINFLQNQNQGNSCQSLNEDNNSEDCENVCNEFY